MNQRLAWLMLTAAGCVAVVYSKVQLAQAQKQAAASLVLCQNRPVFKHAESHCPDINAKPPARSLPQIEGAQNENPSSQKEGSVAERVKINPNTAARWAEGQPAGFERESALNQVAAAWARQDVAAAMFWAGHLTNWNDRVAATTAALFQWGQTDPQKAVACAEACNLGDQTRSTLGILVQKWAGSDLTSAIIYVSQQPSGELKDELLSRVTSVTAERYPNLAAQIVLERMAPGPAQTEAAISILHQWALKDPDGAFAWAGAFPAGELRDRALNEVAGTESGKSVQ